MTGVEGSRLAVRTSFAQPLQSTSRASALGSLPAERSGRGKDDDGGNAVSASISAVGQLVGNLQELFNQDPTRFQQLVTQIAGQRRGASQPEASNGTQAAAAPNSGSAASSSSAAPPPAVAVPPSTSTINPVSSGNPAGPITPVSTPASPTSAVTATPAGSAAAGSTSSTTTATPAQEQSELSQLLAVAANLVRDVLQSGNRSQLMTEHAHGHHGHATYDHQGQRVPSTNSGTSSTNSSTPLQQLIQNLADEVGQAVGSTTK
jgi:hypothetical protein